MVFELIHLGGGLQIGEAFLPEAMVYENVLDHHCGGCLGNSEKCSEWEYLRAEMEEVRWRSGKR